MEIFYDGGKFKVYKNAKYLPRAFFVPKARIIKDRENILNILSSPEFDPKKEVILEEEIQNPKLWITSPIKLLSISRVLMLVFYF